jgi:hypothetical protein
MPLTLTLTEGVLPQGTEKATFTKLCEAMLRWHGLSGNAVMTPNIIGSIQVRPLEDTFSGMNPAPVVFVEWIVPSFAFAQREIQTGYVAEATEIVHEASGRRHPKERIWCNVVHAVDGAWGIGGQALTNAQLGAAVAGIDSPPSD